MTAELFVKISAKLYAERMRLNDVSDVDSESDSIVDDAGISGDEDETGGASLNPSIDGQAQLSMKDNMPPDWHARQLNPYSVLENLGEDDPKVDIEPRSKQWIPSFANSFWDIYVNKLRVNAVEGGICILDESRAHLSEAD